MSLIPAGFFCMGAEHIFNAHPVRQVYVSTYLIDRYLVTNAQYGLFIAAGGYEKPEYWSGDGWAARKEEEWERPRYWEDKPWNEANHPVIGISWFEAEAYSRWAGKKLPTEAQWEKAARGGMWLDGDTSAQEKNPAPGRKYAWGDCEPNEQGVWRAIYKDEPRYGNQSTAPVGLCPDGVSPYGCFDMTGNVWEWCQDWYQGDYYKSSPASDPQGPLFGTSRILRGGSWCREPRQLHVSFRTKDEPRNGGWDLSGFRCARPLTDL